MNVDWKKFLRWLWTIISISIAFLYFIYKSPQNFFTETFKVELDFFLLSIALYVLFLLVATYRWILLLNKPLISLPLKNLFLISSIAKGLGSITPMNTGEFLKAEITHKLADTNRTSQYAIVVVERGLDILTLLLCAVIGIFWQQNFRIWLQEKVIFVLGFLILFLSILIIIISIIYKKNQRFRGIVLELKKVLSLVAEKKLVIPITLLNWVVISFLWWSLFSAFHLSMTYPDVLFLLSLVTFVIVGSFVPGGIGLADVTATELALRMGYLPEQALFFPLAIRANTLISLLFGAITWVVYNWSKVKGQSKN